MSTLAAGAESGLRQMPDSASGFWIRFRFFVPTLACSLILLALLPLKDARPDGTELEFRHVWRIFQNGEFEKSQREAEKGARRWKRADPRLSTRFQILEAKSMLFRGMFEDSLSLLSTCPSASDNSDGAIQKLVLESIALARQQKLPLANQQLSKAEIECQKNAVESCAEVLRARGILAGMQGQAEDARRYYIETLAFVRIRHDRWSEAGTLINLGFAAMQLEHYDEALDWFKSAHQIAVELGDQNTAQKALGNLGWAYFKLGDDERALEQFLQAQQSASALGNISDELGWMSNAGYVYQHTGDLVRAAKAYGQSLELARQLKSNDDIVMDLGDLAHASIDAGKLDEANAYIAQIAPLVSASGTRLDVLNMMLAQARIAAARKDDRQAETIFRTVEHDQASQVSMVLGAQHEIAKLYEREGRSADAEKMYKNALTTFESARAQLKNEDSVLPFFANATRLYDDYIHFLIEHSRSNQALALADQSRARTLAESFGTATSKPILRAAASDPRQIAQRSGSTLLFYWLGQKQSYLWAITASNIALVPLPAQAEIVTRVGRYRRALLDADSPLESANADGTALYQILVEPALKFIDLGKPVILLTDGALSQLNFETLLAPGAGPKPDRSAGQGRELHYWIDDATLLSAPSLSMLAGTKPDQILNRSLLLLGDAVVPDREFPRLPWFEYEAKAVQEHFPARDVAAFTNQRATPAAYLSSNPAAYSYIHFVTHAVSSSTDPLDSAIILSGKPASAESYKLYARDIMQHPINARLVTISACFGSGTRSYAGEGLVGLSWAFLRAGAHSVIGARWEASDDSTPRLMNALYQGIEEGQSPATALRRGKLTLLHSQSGFRAPFFWAPFQLYTR